mmetsp:Transcript_23333/g.36008  ORF Transcript_23333/g.36008 Transcript_23333/m.36008 type:complete len:149 (-) Transcript_23333:6431-6877(-)
MQAYAVALNLEMTTLQFHLMFDIQDGVDLPKMRVNLIEEFRSSFEDVQGKISRRAKFGTRSNSNFVKVNRKTFTGLSQSHVDLVSKSKAGSRPPISGLSSKVSTSVAHPNEASSHYFPDQFSLGGGEVQKPALRVSKKRPMSAKNPGL